MTMALKVSDEGIIFIAQREACVLVAYKDGDWNSIGFGHNGQEVRDGMEITVEEAVDLLVRDIRIREPIVNGVLDRPVTQNEFDAIFSGYYQSGSDLLRDVAVYVNRGDPDETMATLVGHNRSARGVFMFGLAKRRWLELQMFKNADYGDLSLIKVYRGNPKTTAPELIPFPASRLHS